MAACICSIEGGAVAAHSLAASVDVAGGESVVVACACSAELDIIMDSAGVVVACAWSAELDIMDSSIVVVACACSAELDIIIASVVVAEAS